MRKASFPGFLLLAAVLTTAVSGGVEPGLFSLDAYLGQVRGGNEALKASRASASAMSLKSLEIDMNFSPMLTGSLAWLDDRKEPASLFTPERTRADVWSVGLAKKFFTGTTFSANYGMTHTMLFYPALPSMYAGLLPGAATWDALPSLSISQSLLRDFMGGITNSGVAKVKGLARAGELGEKYRAQAALFGAEQSYWSLALARETLKAKEESLGRTTRMRDWTAKRARLNIADKADLLQMDAAVKFKELDLAMSRQNEKSASRAFNSARGREGDFVEEHLEDIAERISFQAGNLWKEGDRLDVQASAAMLDSAKAASRETFYRSLPELNVFGTVALSGHDITGMEAHDRAMRGDWPIYTVGAALTAPLDVFTLSKVRKGYDQDYVAAQASHRNAELYQEQDWKGLLARWDDVKVKLGLATDIRKLQEDRMSAEQKRYENGRITTLQLISAEEDFSSAQLTWLAMGFERLLIEAQARMYNGGYETGEGTGRR